MTTDLHRRIIGVDPGKTGAIAVYRPATGHLAVYDVPIYFKTNAKGRKFKRLDIDALRALARAIGPVDLAVHELVNAMPGEAPAYAFDFGFTSGALTVAFGAQELHRVAPAVWKARMNTSAIKDEARAQAEFEFPDYGHLFARKKDDGRAEAALLALYGARHVPR